MRKQHVCLMITGIFLSIGCMRIGQSTFKPINSDMHQAFSIQGAKTQNLRFELADVPDMDYLMEILDREPRAGQFIYRGNPLKEPLPSHPIDVYNRLVKKGFFLQKTLPELAKNLDFYFLPDEYTFITSLKKQLEESNNQETLSKIVEVLEKEYKYHLEQVSKVEYPTVVEMFKKKDSSSELALKAHLNMMYADLVEASKRLGALRILQMPYHL